MITIKFQHPPTGTKNPFKYFKPSHQAYYPDGPGIYIYGLRKTINNNQVFIPIAVGETDNLKKRLFNDHYRSLKTNGKSKKELFEWGSCSSLIDAQHIYGQMNLYNHLPRKGLRRLPLVSAMTKLHGNKLIWFNNAIFFNSYVGAATSAYRSNTGHMASINKTIGDLYVNFPKNLTALNLAKIIEDNKSLFDDDFYFIYTTSHECIDLDLTVKHNRLNSEKTIKEILSNKLSIHTTADSNRGSIIKLSLDLQSIQDDLICLPGNKYGYPTYTKPLIL